MGFQEEIRVEATLAGWAYARQVEGRCSPRCPRIGLCALANLFEFLERLVGFITTGVHLLPTIEKLSVALPAEMAALVRRAVDLGEYSSNSEVIRDALREWTHKRNLREQGLAGLRNKWLGAIADDSEGLDPDAVFDGLETKYEELAKTTGR
jgi:antitoxin ParD1/3/4